MKILMIAMMFLAACMTSPKPVDTSETSSAIEAPTEVPESVCGLPTQCTPYQCVPGAPGSGQMAICEPGFFADIICDDACGSLTAHCPQPNIGNMILNCERHCTPFSESAEMYQNCTVECMNQKRVSCQTGLGDE